MTQVLFTERCLENSLYKGHRTNENSLQVLLAGFSFQYVDAQSGLVVQA